MVEKPGLADLLAHLDPYGLVVEILRVAYAVQTGYAGDHNHIPPPGHQGRCRTQAQPVDLLVDAQVLFNVGVGAGNICLRLVVVVIGYEILHGILRKE